jgi:hypothetical protein
MIRKNSRYCISNLWKPNRIQNLLKLASHKKSIAKFTTHLNYNTTLKTFDFHQVNRTFYPKYQFIKVEVVVNEEDLEKDFKYSFTLIIKEDIDDDGDGYFIKRPKSSQGKTVSFKTIEKVF